MRYFLINYIRRPDGKTDEVASMSRSIKPKDYQNCAVILDFRMRQVLKASFNGATVPKDWAKVTDFYRQFYQQYFLDLEKHNE